MVVVISYSGLGSNQVEVAGFGQAVLPAPATCTLTLSKDSAVQTATRIATADATTTQCGTLAIPTSQLSRGTWSAVLQLTAAGFAGQSAPVQIEV